MVKVTLISLKLSSSINPCTESLCMQLDIFRLSRSRRHVDFERQRSSCRIPFSLNSAQFSANGAGAFASTPLLGITATSDPDDLRTSGKPSKTCDACQRFHKRDSTRYRHHRIPPPPSTFQTIVFCSHLICLWYSSPSCIDTVLDGVSGTREPVELSDVTR